MNRRQKIIVSITGIFIVLLALVGLTYAYFLTRITGNENDKSISVTTANLELVYDEVDDEYIIGENEIIEPGKEFDEKVFTVTNNGNATIDNYAVILEDVSTTYAEDFVKNNVKILAGTPTSFERPEDFEMTITCTITASNDSTKVGTSCNGMNGTLPIMESTTLEEKYITNGILLTNSIDEGEVHTYSVKLEYVEANEDQSADMNKSLTGKFNIIDANNSVDITGTVANYEVGDKIVTNSTRRESQINSDGSYKIVGLEAEVHSIKLKSGNTETEIDKISIIKGNEVNVGTTTLDGKQVTQITITDDSRTANISINDTNQLVVDNYIEPYNPYKEGTLAYKIFNDDRISKNDTTPKFTGVATEELGLYKAEDDYGISWYFRGAQKNNYVDFVGLTWRIIRINGDGSIRIILEDGLRDASGALIKTEYNHINDNAYAGYMHGTPGVTSEYVCLDIENNIIHSDINDETSCIAANNEQSGGKLQWLKGFDATHRNLSSSTVKNYIDDFYGNRINAVSSMISDTIFCGDKELATNIGKSDNTGLGYGKNITYYAASERLTYDSTGEDLTIAYPTLKCTNKANNDYSRYTVNEHTTSLTNVTTNGDLTYPIGLISADEIVLAGGWNGAGTRGNASFYLYHDFGTEIGTHVGWWTMTPKYFKSVRNRYEAGIYLSQENSSVHLSLNTQYLADQNVIRPVVNLKSDTIVIEGDGTKETPYQLEYVYNNN